MKYLLLTLTLNTFLGFPLLAKNEIDWDKEERENTPLSYSTPGLMAITAQKEKIAYNNMTATYKTCLKKLNSSFKDPHKKEKLNRFRKYQETWEKHADSESIWHGIGAAWGGGEFTIEIGLAKIDLIHQRDLFLKDCLRNHFTTKHTPYKTTQKQEYLINKNKLDSLYTNRLKSLQKDFDRDKTNIRNRDLLEYFIDYKNNWDNYAIAQAKWESFEDSSVYYIILNDLTAKELKNLPIPPI
jgi:hypothetical protein